VGAPNPTDRSTHGGAPHEPQDLLSSDTITRRCSRVEYHRREHVQLRQQGLPNLGWLRTPELPRGPVFMPAACTNHPIETPVRRMPLKIGTTTATYGRTRPREGPHRGALLQNGIFSQAARNTRWATLFHRHLRHSLAKQSRTWNTPPVGGERASEQSQLPAVRSPSSRTGYVGTPWLTCPAETVRHGGGDSVVRSGAVFSTGRFSPTPTGPRRQRQDPGEPSCHHTTPTPLPAGQSG
jgi:hypothetical protein